MTDFSNTQKTRMPLIKSSLAFFALMMCAFFLSDDIAKETLRGLRFSVEVILPSAFPFMVLSDFASYFFLFEKSKTLSALFERIFKINGYAISTLLAGIAGGFPIGAKSALKLYNEGKISKCECERLMSFSNIPSPAYVISAVGGGILSSYNLGITLYIVCLLSSLICGVVIGIRKTSSKTRAVHINKEYSFANSLKSCAKASVNLIFFVSFFSAICGIINLLPISIKIKTILISFSEVANATAFISDLRILEIKFKLSLIAFSLSFSGISILMQSISLEGGSEMSVKNCLVYKLLNGLISMIIILLLPLKT